MSRRFAAAIAGITGQPVEAVDPLVRPSGDAQFGDYQCNAAMGLAKALKLKPRDLAEKIKAAVDVGDLAASLEIAGPGFINIRLSEAALARHLQQIPSTESGGTGVSPVTGGTGVSPITGGTGVSPVTDRFGLPPADRLDTVVIDYSSPNIAKQMHVGHLRSTIIGDALARVLTLEGHSVIRQNHVGDWGTQFGQVILGLWHICMARHRGEPDYVAHMLEQLGSGDETLRNRAFDDVKSRHDQDYAADRDGKQVFLPFLISIRNEKSISLEEIELSYRFVTKLQEVSKAQSDDPYLGLPQRVTTWLQLRDEQERLAWEYCRDATLQYCSSLYQRMGVLLREDDVCGESFYHDRLAPIVEELRRKLPPRTSSLGADAEAAGGTPALPGTAATGETPVPPKTTPPNSTPIPPCAAEVRDDAGAVCVFLYKPDGAPMFKTAEGDPLPLIIQKSDGAYLYATTDLAAIKYRVNELHATRILYVVGAPTKLHLDMVFATARAAGLAGPQVALGHVSFGQVLGDDRKLLRTRSGGAVKLGDLLDEAEKRARQQLEDKLAAEDETYRNTFDESQKQDIARKIGIGAVKYFDLARDRNADYVFNWDQMLALQGNTAPYMMYAYARIRSIYRKAAEQFGSPDVYAATVAIRLDHAAERTLGLRLARLGEVIDVVAAELTPHVLCNYLYELASDFMRFYEACPVIGAESDAQRLSRMRLCDLAARALRLGLGLLGIEVAERM
ncbi:Arginine--tRNA ligase [Phycisphaerae bacterium RAS1]|nr:Arginine--tRNA ligase [Phycisphaerae bacterium RAS1]